VSAAECYLEAAALYAASNDPSVVGEAAYSIDSALWFATTYQQDTLISRTIIAALAELRAASADLKRLIAHGRYLTDLLDLLLRYRKESRGGRERVGNTTLLQMGDAAASAGELLLDAGRPFDAEEFLERAVDASFQAGDPERAYKLRLLAGDATHASAEQRAGTSALAAGLMHGQLAEYYRKVRDDDRTPASGRKELERREELAKAAMLSWVAQGAATELRRVEMHGELTDEEMAGRKVVLDGILALPTMAECLEAAALDAELLPHTVDATDQAAQDLRTYFVARLPQVILTHGMPVSQAAAETEILKLQIDRILQMKIQFISLAYLDALFERLREERGLDEAALTEHLDGWGYIEAEAMTLLRVGFERYFAGDFVSALHILVPQFENVLRTVIEKATADTVARANATSLVEMSSERTVIKPRRGVRGWQYETFGDLLQREFVRTHVQRDIRDYIRIVMSEQTGLNLRNEVAHGLIRPENCTRSTVEIVVHLFLVIRGIFPPRAMDALAVE
jgi:hypothetical protein